MKKTKVCPKCKKRKKSKEFHNSTITKDGKQSYCILCSKVGRAEKCNSINQERIRLAIQKTESLDNEIWLPVVGYEGLYEVSNMGRVKSLPKEKPMFGYIKLTVVRILTLNAINTSGYRCVGLTKNKKKKWASIHRLVAEAFIQNPENKPEVNHIDTNKFNNNYNNLEWVTRPEHVIHTRENIEINRPIGEAHWKAKINDEIVRKIKQMYKSGKYKSYRQIGDVFNLERHHVGNIINGKNWKHVV